MVDLFINEDAELRFQISGQLKKKMSDKDRAVAEILKKIFKNKSLHTHPYSIESLAKTPYAHGIFAYMQGHLTENHATKLLFDLQRTSEEVFERINAHQISVIQSTVLFPEQETRGEKIVLDIDFDEERKAIFLRYTDNVGAALGAEWREFVSIIKFVTIINVPAWPELPYFSGSTSDLWGAMHMCAPRYEEVVAECLTHEAAHFWLNLADETTPISLDPWGKPDWLSPWRHDKRPIDGVIHGVFVFSCVALVLAILLGKSPAASAQSRLRARIEKISSQVRAGAHECIRSNLLTEFGQSIVQAALRRADFGLQRL